MAKKMDLAERIAQTQSFFAKVRRIDESLEDWQARVTVAGFKAQHKALHENGMGI